MFDLVRDFLLVSNREQSATCIIHDFEDESSCDIKDWPCIAAGRGNMGLPALLLPDSLGGPPIVVSYCHDLWQILQHIADWFWVARRCCDFREHDNPDGESYPIEFAKSLASKIGIEFCHVDSARDPEYMPVPIPEDAKEEYDRAADAMCKQLRKARNALSKDRQGNDLISAAKWTRMPSKVRAALLIQAHRREICRLLDEIEELM